MNWILYVAIALLAPTAFVMTYKTGYANAQREAVSDCQSATISQLQSILTDAEQLTTDANTASLVLNQTISDRVIADTKATQEIRNALSTTAHLRIECVVPIGVMQQLDAARNRANKAAASGFDGSLSATTSTD